MKKTLLLLAVFTLSLSTALSLPNFWYSGIAYNSSGQIITLSPLAAVSVSVTDGTNTATQNYINVPVNGFGVFTVQVTAAGTVNMVAGTRITVTVNGVTVAGQPLTQWYIMNNILPAGGSTTDQSIDAWVNNFPQTRIELGTLSDNTTARPAGTEYIINDNGRVSIGTTSTGSAVSSSKVTILNTDLYQGVSALSKVPATSVPYWSSAVVGIDSSNNNFGGGIAGFYSGHNPATGVYGYSSQDVDYSTVAFTYLTGFTGGQFLGGDAGVVAAIAGPGTSTNKYAIKAVTPTINSNTWAGHFTGRIAVVDGTEGNGKVLASDASGNASWQDLITPDIHLSATSCGSQTLPISTQTVINTWTSLSEAGGSNYNPATGEYTIPVSGYYSIDLHTSLSTAPSGGATGIACYILKNGSQLVIGFAASSVTGAYPCDPVAHIERPLIAGDKISFSLIQNTTGAMTINGAASYFSIHLIHK